MVPGLGNPVKNCLKTAKTQLRDYWKLSKAIQNGDNKINEYRISFGANTDFSNNKSIKTYYTFKAEDINKESPDITNIIGLSYNFN